jgi:hypothetical protein
MPLWCWEHRRGRVLLHVYRKTSADFCQGLLATSVCGAACRGQAWGFFVLKGSPAINLAGQNFLEGEFAMSLILTDFSDMIGTITSTIMRSATV